MTLHRTAALGLLVSAFALAACGEDNTETAANPPAQETPAPPPAPADVPAAPADQAAAPPGGNMEAASPPAEAAGNMEAAEPAATPALALADITGRWAPSADRCEAEAMTVAANGITGPGGTCEISSSDGSGNTLSIEAACTPAGGVPEDAAAPPAGGAAAPDAAAQDAAPAAPVGGAAARAMETLLVTALQDDRPASRISIDRDGTLTEFIRCPGS